ncbi:MAG TPA: hypothetical protein VJY62_09490 [Bacteroidia bacterium]|nr:hypothetical protein [Bacteroidia bacterium]
MKKREKKIKKHRIAAMPIRNGLTIKKMFFKLAGKRIAFDKCRKSFQQAWFDAGIFIKYASGAFKTGIN